MFFNTADYYLDLIGDWQDPNPPPVIVEHEGIHVVRDDMLEVGSKARAADYLIRNAKQNEIVYGSSPATGYAQMSLPYVCSKYGKKAVIFMAERSMDKLHPYQKKAIELGADMRWVKMGMLPVTEKRARDYVAEDPDNKLLVPIGVRHDTAIGCLIKVARSLPIEPTEVWSVGSSGTLTRSLQLAFPKAMVHVVSVGHTMKEEDIGRAYYHKSPYKFDKPVKKEHVPPFPSAPTYDAKAWHIMKDYQSIYGKSGDTCLFWNVGA
jgi:hypothetical protein